MKITVDENGASASDAHEGKKNPKAKGEKKASHAHSTWTFADHDQLGKFMRGVDGKEHPLHLASKGDKSAAMDAARDHAREMEKRG